MTLATVPRYDGDREVEGGERAVVIGASMAGLLAARVLADAFDEVTVVDRDPLPDEPIARRGVPQAEHIHVLLEGGRATLEDLFPGYGEELLAAGGLVIDNARDVGFYSEGDFLAEGPRRIPLYCATRPLYERLVRRRVAALDGVHLRQGCRFRTYRVDDAGTTVEGAAVTDEEGGTEDLAADLVVDATGRASRTPARLEKRGYPSPAVDEVSIDLAYGTTLVERPADDRRAFLVTAFPPHTRGGAALPVEGDRWMVTLFGLHGDHPPRDPAGFREFAAGLPTPELSHLLDEQPRATEEITGYRFPASRRYRYEDLERFPEGLVVVGDAIASFNPIYGQGMSVAAFEALELHHALAAGGRDALARRFFERAAETVDAAWNMAVGGDHRFPRTVGPKPRGTDLANRYFSRLLRTAHADGVLADAFFRVLLMERPASSLLRPRIAWRVFAPARPTREIALRRRFASTRVR
ncbi:FAD-dependent oxidoreductase [Salinilacihabitans rarus]|uniref:FAD-dependent oxidoreductase n=1 Tax=Salinilacihabitans rarus TaxID=2961596 RepID=UPI0020C85A4B|nr:FAD-dependent monooxygenase [Salinilacihabitans rarus]